MYLISKILALCYAIYYWSINDGLIWRHGFLKFGLLTLPSCLVRQGSVQCSLFCGLVGRPVPCWRLLSL